jgi:hypothetical protein
MQNNKWARLLAYVTGLVNQQLLVQNEYLAAESRMLRSHLPARLTLSDPERSTLAEMGKRLARRGLEQVASVAQPDTILAWYRRLVARKFDGSKRRSFPGRPRIDDKTEALIIRMARENSGWGYERIVGALANLGQGVSDQTVANVLRRNEACPYKKHVCSPLRHPESTFMDRPRFVCSISAAALLSGWNARGSARKWPRPAIISPPASTVGVSSPIVSLNGTWRYTLTPPD